MATPNTPARVLAAALAADPATPFLTFYDDATGERVELSLATLDNWVAKTANLLQDGLGVDPGGRVAIMLPPHWQGAVWMLAAWSAGLTVTVDEGAGADLVVTGPDRLAELTTGPAAGAGDTVALALRPLGGPFTEPLPAGVLDYGAEVPGYADQFTAYVPVDPHSPALVAPDATLTGEELVAAAGRRAAEIGLEPGGRLLTDANPADPYGCLDALLAPLTQRGSVILVRNPDLAQVDRRCEVEKVTVTRLRAAGR
ncbi:TIGR03089 family protein [Actinopolymorpha singaporensis]|uniref:TIGR03089 family protein n=1 Tax=Actinopolymorpha singaporensis TaxID=117157 RepID=A0A1H1STX1_9ACTN|nr:TIGR03089 family protein [Actinopolymorpha singaporensis]SDS51470.1 TIGR03089 family protein [Actinopolymorpha singaporensis]